MHNVFHVSFGSQYRSTTTPMYIGPIRQKQKLQNNSTTMVAIDKGVPVYDFQHQINPGMALLAPLADWRRPVMATAQTEHLISHY